MYPNDLKSQLKRQKKPRMKSSSSVLSSHLSNEFYLEYFKILKSIENPSQIRKTIEGQRKTAWGRKKSKSNKRMRTKGLRPKSAPGTRIFNKINKSLKGTVDAIKLHGYPNNNTMPHEILEIKKSFINNRKSFSPQRNKKKIKSKKRSGKKYKKRKFSLQKNITGPKILNFKFNPHLSPELEITLKEAKAAFFIFFCWKMKKLMRNYQEEGIFMINFTQRNSLDNVSNWKEEGQEGRTSDLVIYNKYKDCTINTENNLKNGIDRYNELNFRESEKQDSEWDLKSFNNLEESQEFSTVFKAKSQKSILSEDFIRSENLEEGDSNLTKILIKSTRECEEIQEIGGNQDQRNFEEEIEHSPWNPFEEIQDTLEVKEKIVHLSTINTNEQIYPENGWNKDEDIHITNEGAIKALEDLGDSGSLVEVISQKDEPEESLISEK